MPFAIDLSPRQSARTLQQAIRYRAEVLIEPRIWEQAEPIACRLEPPPEGGSRRDGSARVMVLSYDLTCESPGESTEAPAAPRITADQFGRLIGTYCDLAIRLGENVYLCSADVIKVIRPAEPDVPLIIHLTRPEMLQVAQRRRFRRFQLADSAKVRITWRREGEPANEGIGWLCNVGADGLACRIDTHTADRLWIGEIVRVDFTLAPTDPQRFVFDAAICNKTPAGSEGKMIVGLQFQTDPQHASSLQMAEALRQRLWDRGLLASRTQDEESL